MIDELAQSSPLRNSGAAAAAAERREAWTVRLAREAVLRRLAGFREGRLTIDDGGRMHRFGESSAGAPDAAIRVLDPSFWIDVALRGTLGAGEAYMDGRWTSDDLTALVRLFVLNRAALIEMEGGLAKLSAPFARLAHALRANTQRGSRRNIAAHYDLGDDFFRLFLDETMMYSSAVFERPDATLAEASRAKLDRIGRKLQLSPDDHVLEIGTGWGGFAIHAARQFGCRVTTTTISRNQFECATARVREAGLADRVEVLLQDYRELDGKYDKIVSIEMIEAVGADHLDRYFECCGRLLKSDGMMLLQAITIADSCYDLALRSVDFIQQHVFPGSFIPSVSAMTGAIKRTTQLKLTHLEDIGPHYARTLRAWRENFRANLAAVRAQGFPESFIRMWEYYLCYCEGGFEERQLGAVQMLLAAPRCRREPVLAV